MLLDTCYLLLIMPDENQQAEPNIDQLQKDLDATTSSLKRALADFDNFKKQKERENKELLEFAKEVTVVKLLPTLDALEQALRHMPILQAQDDGLLAGQEDRHQAVAEFVKAYKNWQTGINGILGQLDKTLGELGVKKIEAIGKKFDPHFHEAVREVESEKEDGIILDELQSGFILNGKVIRASQVIISKRVASIK